MRHEFRIRFGRTLRAVRVADPNASPANGTNRVTDPTARALLEQAAAKELEQQQRQAIEDVLAGLTEAVDSLTSSRNELLGEMQQAAVELATAIATRVTYDKLQSDRFAIEELVRAVVGRIDSSEPVRVRMHPEDLALLDRRRGTGNLREHDRLQLVPDDSLGRGDCVADSGDVSFASHLEEQLDGLRQHLLRNLSDAQVERRKAATGDRELRRFPDRRQTA